MRFGRSLLLIGTMLISASALPVVAQDATPAASDEVTIVASGLTGPRGFAWDDDGSLYLTLAGTGGENEGTIDGNAAGIFGGPTSSVVKVEAGCADPLVEGLPSGNWRDEGWIWGAHDVAFLDGQMYILSAGGGEDFGNPDEPTALLRLEEDMSTTMIADLSTWSIENPPEFMPPDYNPSGSFFDIEVADDRLWLSEAVGGRIITVTPDGTIELITDISDGHPVPTGMAMAPEGGVYVGYLTAIPYTDGSAKVVHVAEDGSVTDYWTGLTAVNDIALGPDGTLYAVEMATGNTEKPPFASPESGRIVRMTGPDSLEPVVTDIPYPVYLGFDAEGALYLTTPGFAPNDGVEQGALVQVPMNGGSPVSVAGLDTSAPTCPAS